MSPSLSLSLSLPLQPLPANPRFVGCGSFQTGSNPSLSGCRWLPPVREEEKPTLSSRVRDIGGNGQRDAWQAGVLAERLSRALIFIYFFSECRQGPYELLIFGGTQIGCAVRTPGFWPGGLSWHRVQKCGRCRRTAPSGLVHWHRVKRNSVTAFVSPGGEAKQ